MVRWNDVVREAPELAGRVRECFAVGKHATMATLRRDGSPRISGTEVEFSSDGQLRLGSMPGAVKTLDLRRDPRLAVHSPTVDPPEDSLGAWRGEAKVSGRAVEISAGSPGEQGHTFDIDVTEVVLTTIGEPADHLVIESWHPGRGYRRRVRR